MRVFLQPPQPSRGLQRIADALTRYAPQGVAVTNTHAEADLVIIYAIGRRERIAGQTRHLLEQGRKYAIIQVCLKSTMNPEVDDWVDIWDSATVVWSYYDLALEFYRKGYTADGGWRFPQHFLHAPLGVDSSVFRFSEPVRHAETGQLMNYVVLSSGLSRLSESVRECHLAAKQVGRNSCHISSKLNMEGMVDSFIGLDDYRLAQLYSSCEFVSGLRRKEGFELPAAEGLLCGARPILFDSLDYRFNYKNWGLYIREGSRQEVVDQLVQLFKQGARPVTEQEREEAAHWFNWERVCGEFWQRCLS